MKACYKARFLKVVGEESYSNVRRTPQGSTSANKLSLTPKRRKPAIKAGFLKVVGEEPYSNVRRTPLGSTSVSKLCLKPKRRKPAKKQAFLKWSVKRDSNPRPSGPKPDALPSCAIHRDVLQKLCSVNGCVYYGFWLTTQELSAVFL